MPDSANWPFAQAVDTRQVFGIGKHRPELAGKSARSDRVNRYIARWHPDPDAIRDALLHLNNQQKLAWPQKMHTAFECDGERTPAPDAALQSGIKHHPYAQKPRMSMVELVTQYQSHNGIAHGAP